jgi:hypothetical protein
MRFRKSADSAAEIPGVCEIAIDMFHAELKPAASVLDFMEREIPTYIDLFQINGTKPAFCSEPQMNNIVRIHINHVTADCIHRTGISAHDYGSHVERRRGKHHLLSRDYGVHSDKICMYCFLKVCDLVFKEAVMIDEPMAVILNSYEIFQTQSQPCPGMSFEFGKIDEEIALDNRLWNEHGIPQALRIRELYRNLFFFIKVAGFHMISG